MHEGHQPRQWVDCLVCLQNRPGWTMGSGQVSAGVPTKSSLVCSRHYITQFGLHWHWSDSNIYSTSSHEQHQRRDSICDWCGNLRLQDRCNWFAYWINQPSRCILDSYYDADKRHRSRSHFRNRDFRSNLPCCITTAAPRSSVVRHRAFGCWYPTRLHCRRSYTRLHLSRLTNSRGIQSVNQHERHSKHGNLPGYTQVQWLFLWSHTNHLIHCHSFLLADYQHAFIITCTDLLHRWPIDRCEHSSLHHLTWDLPLRAGLLSDFGWQFAVATTNQSLRNKQFEFFENVSHRPSSDWSVHGQDHRHWSKNRTKEFLIDSSGDDSLY